MRPRPGCRSAAAWGLLTLRGPDRRSTAASKPALPRRRDAARGLGRVPLRPVADRARARPPDRRAARRAARAAVRVGHCSWSSGRCHRSRCPTGLLGRGIRPSTPERPRRAPRSHGRPWCPPRQELSVARRPPVAARLAEGESARSVAHASAVRQPAERLLPVTQACRRRAAPWASPAAPVRKPPYPGRRPARRSSSARPPPSRHQPVPRRPRRVSPDGVKRPCRPRRAGDSGRPPGAVERRRRDRGRRRSRAPRVGSQRGAQSGSLPIGGDP